MLSEFRGIARSLIGKSAEEREKMEAEIIMHLKKLGVLEETAVLDNVLDLTIEDIFERRLQTIVYRKGLAKTIQQARQLITHGHIAIGDKRVTIPSYMVTREEEKQIGYAGRSAVANPSHPLRQTIMAAPPTSGSEGQSQNESRPEGPETPP